MMAFTILIRMILIRNDLVFCLGIFYGILSFWEQARLGSRLLHSLWATVLLGALYKWARVFGLDITTNLLRSDSLFFLVMHHFGWRFFARFLPQYNNRIWLRYFVSRLLLCNWFRCCELFQTLYWVLNSSVDDYCLRRFGLNHIKRLGYQFWRRCDATLLLIEVFAVPIRQFSCLDIAQNVALL